MHIFLAILSVILLGVIINYAFSPQSSRILRLASLGALVLIALSLGVASIVIAVSGFSKEAEEVHLPIFLEAQGDAPKGPSNLFELIVCLAILAFVLILIVVVYSRDRKKMREEAKKAGSKRYPGAAAASDTDQQAEEAPAKAKEDEFDLNL